MILEESKYMLDTCTYKGQRQVVLQRKKYPIQVGTLGDRERQADFDSYTLMIYLYLCDALEQLSSYGANSAIP